MPGFRLDPADGDSGIGKVNSHLVGKDQAEHPALATRLKQLCQDFVQNLAGLPAEFGAKNCFLIRNTDLERFSEGLRNL